MASLTIGTNTIDDLDITTNAKLATLAATALTTNGTSTAGTVDIYDNAFVASLVKDSQESDATVALTTYAKGGTADGGSITSTSGLNGLDTYLADAAATAGVQNVWFDSVTKLEVQSTYGGAYTDMTSSLPTSAPARTGLKATDFTSTYSGYMNYFFQSDATALVTRTVGAVGAQKISYAFNIVRNTTTQAEARTLLAAEGLQIWQNDIMIGEFNDGDAYTSAANSATVETLDDLIAYINADTTMDNGYNVDMLAAEDSFVKAMYTISYTSSSGANATAGAVSTAGNLNFTFGNYNSGSPMDLTVAIAANDTAGLIAADLITGINTSSEYTAAATCVNANQF
jgi:hypothetical protein